MSRVMTRAGAVLATVAAVGVTLVGVSPDPTEPILATSAAFVDPTRSASVADWNIGLVGTATVGVWLALAWLLLVTMTALGASLPGAAGRAADTANRLLVPATLRRAVAAMIGLGLAAGTVVAPPAGASTAATAPTERPTARPLPDVDLDWPVRPRGTPSPGSAAHEGPRGGQPHPPGPPTSGPPPASGPGPPGPERTSGSGTAREPGTAPGPGRVPAPGAAPQPGAPPEPGAAPGTAPESSGRPRGRASPPATPPPATPPPATPPSAPPGAPKGTPPPERQRPPAGTDSGNTPPTERRPAQVSTVVVRRGDSLWRLASRALGHRSTDAAVAAEWPRWWAVNREVVGDHPELIYPGQRLRVPPRAHP
jgi:nucleoid-associated protein YgaU